MLHTERLEKIKLMDSINKLEQKIESIEKAQTTFSQAVSTNNATEYETDEEDLNKEFDWIVNKKKKQNKKRKMSRSPEVSPEQKQKQALKQTTTIPTATSTREKQEIKIPTPPPVIITNVQNYHDIMEIMRVNEIQYRTSKLNSGDIKVNVPDGDNYRKLTKLLNEKNTTWYSYEDKQVRPTKVIVKKLHQSCQPEAIKEDLLDKEYKITEVNQILKKGSRAPLPIYMLTFDRTEDIKKIYAIEEILHMKVQIEAVKKSKLIPQCKKCQAYGHTQNYCNKSPRCVKCIGKHETSECSKPKTLAAQCVNCGEAHPANYRGCTVATELQNIRNKTNQNKRMHPANEAVTQRAIYNTSYVNPNVTFAEKVSNSTSDNISVDQTKILQVILNRLDAQEEKQEKTLTSILQRLTQLEKRRQTSELALSY